MCGFVHQGTRRIQAGDAISNLETNSLELANLLPKGFTLVGITGADFQCTPSQTKRTRGTGHPFGDHHLIEYIITSVFLADQVLHRNWHISKIYPPSASNARAHQPINMLYFYTRRAFHQERADGFVTGAICA